MQLAPKQGYVYAQTPQEHIKNKLEHANTFALMVSVTILVREWTTNASMIQ